MVTIGDGHAVALGRCLHAQLCAIEEQAPDEVETKQGGTVRLDISGGDWGEHTDLARQPFGDLSRLRIGGREGIRLLEEDRSRRFDKRATSLARKGCSQLLSPLLQGRRGRIPGGVRVRSKGLSNRFDGTGTWTAEHVTHFLSFCRHWKSGVNWDLSGETISGLRLRVAFGEASPIHMTQRGAEEV
jgi:hypothetical protein